MTRLQHRSGALPAGRDFLLVFALLAAGMVTMAFGLLALLGWVSGWLRLASFVSGFRPMAPTTAVLFLLYGAAICVRARMPLSGRTFRISMVAGWLGTLVALLLFVLFCLGIHCGVEHLGLNTTGTVYGAALGHMSPVTACCFLLASVSFLASLSQSAIRAFGIMQDVTKGIAWLELVALATGEATDMTVWSGNMRESTTWRSDRSTAELPTVQAVAPTSYMVPILTPAWTVDKSRIRVPHDGKVLTRCGEVRIMGTTWASPDDLHSASDGGRNRQSGHLNRGGLAVQRMGGGSNSIHLEIDHAEI